MADKTLSYSMQFLALRAKAEADHLHRECKGIEYWFLGILKLSELRARDAFRLPEEELKVIDEDIAAARKVFRDRLIDTGLLRLRLRHEIKHGAKLEPEMESEYMKRALGLANRRGEDKIWAQDLLMAILQHPPKLLVQIVLDDQKRSASGNKPGEAPAGKDTGKTGGGSDGKQAGGSPGADGPANRKKIDEGPGGAAGQAPDAGGGPEEEPDEMSPAYLAWLTARVRRLRKKLLETVQGQDHVVHAFCEGYFASEMLAAAETGRKRPRAVFAFIGPPGVGKTFLAEQAAAELCLPYMRFNMSTYSEHQAYMGLIGFEKSYQAARDGVLTGFVKKNPHSILLFDEIEKAHLNTINLFLQVLDAGVLQDRFYCEDVSFKDTIIIFTSNAGTSLYKEGAGTNGAGLSRKILLKALETEKDPRTGQPFFPAAITSRLATGWPILYNHLGPQNLAMISEREFSRVSRLFEKQYGVGIGFDRTVATALLFREGGAADARTVRAQTELFFKNEVFKVCRLWGEDNFSEAVQNLRKLIFTVETDGLPADVRPLFFSEENPEILFCGSETAAAEIARRLPEAVIRHAKNMEEAMETAGTQDIRLALVEIAGRYSGMDKAAAGPAAGKTPGRDASAGSTGNRLLDAALAEALAEKGAAGKEEDFMATVFEGPGAGPAGDADDLMATVQEGLEPGEEAGDLFLSVGAFDFLPMAAGVFRDGARIFAALRERMPEIPVYLLETSRLPLDEELVMNYVRLGARGKISLQGGSGSSPEAEIPGICEDLWMQKTADRLAAEHKILSFETAPALSDDQTEVHIRLRGFSIRRAPDAEDADSVLDEAEKPDVRFSDVIGCGDAKDELRFFIEFLKNPKKFSARGLKPPKGVLLYGPPGTGKTMLARAMAGESEAAFLPAVASSFVTRYQGSGPESVRELFRKARRYAPAVVFIDEIDAIGSRRGDRAGAHPEEMALNALLTEMDGFEVDPKRPVFVLAATNFEIREGQRGMGILDPALVRRFDRQVLIGLPDTEDREKLLRMLLSKNTSSEVTDEMIRRTAERSVGMSPAVLTGVVEQASRMAVKAGGSLNDAILDEAFELTKHGEKKDWGYEYLERVARHESGHAFLCYLGGTTPAYLTIEARGSHGGYMEHSEKEMGPLSTRRQLIDRIRTSLGGRAAEIVYYGEEEGISTGASGDLRQATQTAAAMLCSYGMDEEFGLVAMDPGEAMKDPAFRARVGALLNREMQTTVELIRKNRSRMDRLVRALLRKNKLTAQEIEEQLRKK